MKQPYLKKSISMAILFFLMAMAIVSFAPIAKANAVVQSTQTSVSTTYTCNSCTQTRTVTPFSIGDMIIVVIVTENAASGNCPDPTTVSSVGDSQSNSYAQQEASACSSGLPNYASADNVYIYSTKATAASLMTVTVTYTGSSGANAFSSGILVIDVSGVSNFLTGGTNTGTTSLANGGTMQLLSAISYPVSSVIVQGTSQPGTSNPTAGTGFSTVSSGYNNFGYEYGLDSNVASPSACPSVTASVAAAKPYALACAIFSFTTTSSVQTQTIGSCPKAGNGHVVPANSTQYWYSGNALGSEVVNTVQTEVSSVKGSSAQNIQLVLYVSTAQSPSAQNPATLAWYQIISVSAGTTNSTITFQVNIPLNTIASGTLPFNFWAVGLVGNDHVYIVQSTLSGMTTQSGNAAGSVQPYSFTSAGSASGLKMGLCATGNYQSVLPAVTTTVTTGGTTSTTVSTTTTQTVSTIGPALFSTASNWPIIFLILVLPAGLFLGATRTLAGALLGLAVGSVIGLMMGILPPFVFAGLLIALVAVAFIARERSN